MPFSAAAAAQRQRPSSGDAMGGGNSEAVDGLDDALSSMSRLTLRSGEKGGSSSAVNAKEEENPAGSAGAATTVERGDGAWQALTGRKAPHTSAPPATGQDRLKAVLIDDEEALNDHWCVASPTF